MILKKSLGLKQKGCFHSCNFYVTAAAKGLTRRPNLCYGRGCGKSYVYPYDLRVHLLKNPQCQEGANVSACPIFFSLRTHVE